MRRNSLQLALSHASRTRDLYLNCNHSLSAEYLFILHFLCLFTSHVSQIQPHKQWWIFSSSFHPQTEQNHLVPYFLCHRFISKQLILSVWHWLVCCSQEFSYYGQLTAFQEYHSLKSTAGDSTFKSLLNAGLSHWLIRKDSSSGECK